MYQPSHFEERRPEALQQLLNAYPLGALVTITAGELNANHVPFEFDPRPQGDAAPHGVLRAHVARANPVWRDFSGEMDALVIFQGPQAYISPNWYPTKQHNGQVVPTYNYMVVHAYGRIRAIEDRHWLRALVGRLTDRHEAILAAPWKVDDAPDEYIDKMLGAIVGIEIPVRKLIGKWKASQNRVPDDRAGVVTGLQRQGGENPLAMAEAVQEKG
jgi:transcriptional regulator